MKSDLSLGWCGPTNFRSRPGTLLTLKGVQQLWWRRWGGGGELLVQLLQLWWGRWGGGGKLLVQLLLLRPAGASGHGAGCAVPRATTVNKNKSFADGDSPPPLCLPFLFLILSSICEAGRDVFPREMQNINRGCTFGDFVTVHREGSEGSMQDVTVARLQSKRVQTPLFPLFYM
jgi:hypothetical protein